MKVFVTGATGFIGSAVVQELLENGHQVLGLARSEESAEKLTMQGASAHRGDLNDVQSLKSGASICDAVIHLGFVHDFSNFAEMCALDHRVITAIVSELIGSEKQFLITSGTALFAKEGITYEKDRSINNPHPRIATEKAADEMAAENVKVAVIRLSPSVHGEGDLIGFVPSLIKIAREKGMSAMISDGNNHWPAVHRSDAAKLYRLALEHSFVPGTRFHAVAEQGIPFKDIAAAIAQQLSIPLISIDPEAAEDHFGWFAHFAKLNNVSSSQETQINLEWHPENPSLLEDLKGSVYFPQNK
jgi:nucleoside-diphosphate-sugar epimerase